MKSYPILHAFRGGYSSPGAHDMRVLQNELARVTHALDDANEENRTIRRVLDILAKRSGGRIDITDGEMEASEARAAHAQYHGLDYVTTIWFGDGPVPANAERESA